jgi:hypothetical protein
VRTFYIISFTHKFLASCVYNSHCQVPIDGVTVERCVMVSFNIWKFNEFELRVK